MPPIISNYPSHLLQVNTQPQLVQIRRNAGNTLQSSTNNPPTIRPKENALDASAVPLQFVIGNDATSPGDTANTGRTHDTPMITKHNALGLGLNSDLAPWDGSPKTNTSHYFEQSLLQTDSTRSPGIANESVNALAADEIRRPPLVAIQPSPAPTSSARTVKLPALQIGDSDYASAFNGSKVLSELTWGEPRAFETTADAATFEFSAENSSVHKQNLKALGLVLPNVGDDGRDHEDAAREGIITKKSAASSWTNTTPIETLKSERDDILRATLASQLLRPDASKNIRHYLNGDGVPLQREVDTKFFADETKAEHYRNALERYAIGYAQSHPDAKEFTIQGPLFNDATHGTSDRNDYDNHLAFGRYWVGVWVTIESLKMKTAASNSKGQLACSCMIDTTSLLLVWIFRFLRWRDHTFLR
jgi:hypothetical protein